ncbi:DUF4286 family protein [Mycobacterium aquaticum]|uniref:EthD domain-containing protein n=1 Tax=Mycobacterium aquaticum TaxID=1927124 RepID=A0A1X0BAB7_9MYCO|nr:DUF4286 family protein [Mycobacterium aquaticum]ORA39243.1 hypothetical protein BST13_02980 [Mycobacterium aquaticum]
MAMTFLSRPNLLLVVQGTFDDAVDRSDFDRWYDEKHLPQISACPGFEWGLRYYAVEHERRFLTIYGLADADALRTPEFTSRRGFDQFTAAVDFRTTLYRAHSISETSA